VQLMFITVSQVFSNTRDLLNEFLASNQIIQINMQWCRIKSSDLNTPIM
jgi:hypothetical protein